MEKNQLNNTSSNKSCENYKGAESGNTHKKITSLKEIYEKNLSYPFIYKTKEPKNVSSFNFSKSENKEIPKEESKDDTTNDKTKSY